MKKISQKEFLFRYYKKRPLEVIKHEEIIPDALQKYKQKYGQDLKDPDRAIRKLYEEGKLIKVAKGQYKYDPNYQGEAQAESFSSDIRNEIFKRDDYKCVICGKGKKEGVELHADHIKPRSKGGQSTVKNGQTLCSDQNMLKKNLDQTETGKKMFIKLYELAKSEQNDTYVQFTKDILAVYKKYNINGHISWNEDD